VGRGITVGGGQQPIGSKGYGGETVEERRSRARENKTSWDFVDNSDPVITAATVSERHESNLIQWQWNFVGGDVVLDVVRDALAEGLDGKAE